MNSYGVPATCQALLLFFVCKYTRGSRNASSTGCSLGLQSAHSCAIAPVMAEPSASPSLFTMTPPYLQSRETRRFCPVGFRGRITTAARTFFLSSGLPCLTVAIIMSPTPAAGSLFNGLLTPFTENTYRFLAPVFISTVEHGSPRRLRQVRGFAWRSHHALSSVPGSRGRGLCPSAHLSLQPDAPLSASTASIPASAGVAGAVFFQLLCSSVTF